jgi:hypothetical protein
MRRLLPLLVLFSLAACRGDRVDAPEEAYRTFTAAWKRSELPAMWDSLSPDTRKLLEDRTREVVAASKGAIKDDPKAPPDRLPQLLAFASGVKAQPITDLKVLETHEAMAMLEVTEGGVKRQQKMVKVGERWYVDLTESLKAGAGSP